MECVCARKTDDSLLYPRFGRESIGDTLIPRLFRITITIRLFSGGSFGFLGLFNLFLAHTNVFYGRTTGADQKEHTLSN